MVQKWQDDYKAIDNFEKRLTEYKKVLEKRYSGGNSHYHDHRMIICLQDKNT